MTLHDDIQQNPTIFGKILRGEIPCDKVYEDDKILAFRDIAPKAKVHVLIIPKKHIPDLRFIGPEDDLYLNHLRHKLNDIAKLCGVYESGFRLTVNCGGDSGQEVPHLHFHMLGGEPLKGDFDA